MLINLLLAICGVGESNKKWKGMATNIYTVGKVGFLEAETCLAPSVGDLGTLPCWFDRVDE